MVKTPKLYINDVGFASFLCGVHTIKQLENSNFTGHLAETWIYSELRKLVNLETNININFYRTHRGAEVDFILEKANKLCSIEFKWSSSVTKNDFRGLIDLQQAIGKTRKFYGVVLYTGNTIVSFGENLAAIPICYLAGK